MRRFFDPFLFEETPAIDRRADKLYLAEVEQCDIYIGLFGSEYGFEGNGGLSPTEQEFELAKRLNKHRLVFIKGADDRQKHPKMQALISKANKKLVRRRFVTKVELIVGVYAALVQYLESRQLIRTVPFDAAECQDASMDDISPELVRRFAGIARRARGFPLPEDTDYIERMGTGIEDMIERCRKAGLPEPEFKLTDGFVTTLRRQPERAFATVGGEVGGPVTPPVTPPVAPPVAPPVDVLVRLLGQAGALGNAEIRAHLGLKDRTHLRERYLDPALADGLIEPTIPDKPNSRLQQYRLTVKGEALLSFLRKGNTGS